MRVDPALSVYQERPDARAVFTRQELKKCQCLLRRLRFLEKQLRESTVRNDGAMFTEWEVEALEWALDELGYLAESRVAPAASH